MNDVLLPDRIPPSLYRFFWDVDSAKVNPRTSPEYVINRLLDKGNLEAARWVLHAMPRQIVIDAFKNRRDFSPRTGTFWAQYLGISEKEVACLNPSYLKTRRQHWPY